LCPAEGCISGEGHLAKMSSISSKKEAASNPL
jgi:hypothetical protein